MINNTCEELSISPLIRWAGGKRQIVNQLTNYLPQDFNTYFEPMIGSGAMFFALKPTSAVVADLNPELVNFYKVIKIMPEDFYNSVDQLKASKTTYYRIRNEAPLSPLARAVRFFYLIRLSWNGLYRVNKLGNFNVPFGGRQPKELIALGSVLNISNKLKNTRLVCGDFESTTEMAKRGDLVYFDPPYPKGATYNNGFARYHETGFNFEDHERLAKYARQLMSKGVHVLITEAATHRLLNLYKADFHIRLVRSKSLIAADSDHRRVVYESIITSYPIMHSTEKHRLRSCLVRAPAGDLKTRGHL